MTLSDHRLRPPAWEILETAIAQRSRVRLRYRGHERITCPHALGWKTGRLVALVYQCAGETTAGSLPADPRQRWRSMFIDNIEHADIVDGSWQSADNYSPHTIPLDTLITATDLK